MTTLQTVKTFKPFGKVVAFSFDENVGWNGVKLANGNYIGKWAGDEGKVAIEFVNSNDESEWLEFYTDIVNPRKCECLVWVNILSGLAKVSFLK